MTDVVLVIVETRRGVVLDSSLSALGAAAAIKSATGARIALGIIDADPERIARMIDFQGVDRIIGVRPDRAGFDPFWHAAAVTPMVRETNARVVIFGHSVDSIAVAPAVAARLELGLATDIIDLSIDEGELRATKAAYGGQLLEDLAFPHGRAVITVRANTFAAPTRRDSGTPRVEEITVADPGQPTTHLRWIDPADEGADITKADLLVSVGRPIGGIDNVARIDKLAAAMGGLMSASRPVIDAGWADRGRQVGQTGKTVKPKVYLALGISGAIQHLAGMSGSETVIAVNIDPQAPIVAIADYVADVDMMDLIDALESATGL